MKIILAFISLLLLPSVIAQDSTYRCIGGYVDVTRIGIGNMHKVEGARGDNDWITGKVKRINYEYTYTRTFHGSTQPANPKEFYKPIKAKSFYFVPVSDFLIKYHVKGKVYQTLSMDSLILRSYYEDGTPKDIYYFNDKLQADSILRFYGNGKLKLKVMGSYGQIEENLVLSLNHRPEIRLKSPVYEWVPDNRWYLRMPFRSDGMNSGKTSYPKKQLYCHGNGKPQIVITWIPDSIGATTYHPNYEFFDPEGNRLDSNKVDKYDKWTGIRYNYYDSGVLESINEVCEDRHCGIYKRFGTDGLLTSIQYYNSRGRDSTVYYKQLKDTLFTWRPPLNYTWNKQDTLTLVESGQFKMGFNNDGSVWYIHMDGGTWEAYRTYRDERLQLHHFGTKDTLGFPHGRWYGVNVLNDTVYDINYHHGVLHGPYRVSNSAWENSATRMFHMGKEIDSTVRFHKGRIKRILYFSEPGKLAAEAYFGNEGKLWYVDTIINGGKKVRLRSLHRDGWYSERTYIDTTLKQIHTKRYYYAPDSLSQEVWRDYRDHRFEWKEYHRETGALKVHWKEDGYFIELEDNPDPDKPPLKRAVRKDMRWTYDESGDLIKEECYENGALVE